eukprot:2608151-Amphidinium_carterae.1
MATLNCYWPYGSSSYRYCFQFAEALPHLDDNSGLMLEAEEANRTHAKSQNETDMMTSERRW